MKIVLDTNVLVSAIPLNSEFHWIYESVFDGTFILCVSTDMMEEYAEIIERFYGHNVTEIILTAISYSPFIEHVSPSYFWNLVEQDADDNKFVDCAIAAGANYIVTNDRHFSILKRIAFPKVLTIKPSELKLLLK